MMSCPGGADEGASVRVITLKAADATMESIPEYTITKSFPATVPLGTVTVGPEGIAFPAVEVKLPVVPERHATEVELVLKQSL